MAKQVIYIFHIYSGESLGPSDLYPGLYVFIGSQYVNNLVFKHINKAIQV